MYWQPDGSEVIEVGDLGSPLAKALHDFIVGPAASYAADATFSPPGRLRSAR